jgi:hypothetical protein
LRWVRHFEKLHNIYLRDRKKKEFCIKRVYPHDTFLLYSKGNLLIFAVVENGKGVVD